MSLQFMLHSRPHSAHSRSILWRPVGCKKHKTTSEHQSSNPDTTECATKLNPVVTTPIVYFISSWFAECRTNMTHCPFHWWEWITNRKYSLNFIQTNWRHDKFRRGECQLYDMLWHGVGSWRRTAAHLHWLINSGRAFAHDFIALASFMQLSGKCWHPAWKWDGQE